MSDDPIHESKRKRSRNGIASYLRRVARALGRGERVAADEEQTVTVDPAAEPDLEIEVDSEDGTVTFDIGMEWEESEGGVETEVNASKATFEVYEDAEGKHRWRLRHRNGNVIADGSEGYASKQKAEQGLESVRSNAPGAYVVDLSRDETVDEECGGSDATFEIFEDKEGKWRWRLEHDNGNIIADGGQGYASKQKAKQGLRSVKQNTPGAAIEEPE